MDSTGDIPGRDEIDLKLESAGATAIQRVKAAKTIAEAGGTVHAYLPRHGDGEDYHLNLYNSHFFPDQGYIFHHGNDEDHWIFGDQITDLERHYD